MIISCCVGFYTSNEWACRFLSINLALFSSVDKNRSFINVKYKKGLRTKAIRMGNWSAGFHSSNVWSSISYSVKCINNNLELLRKKELKKYISKILSKNHTHTQRTNAICMDPLSFRFRDSLQWLRKWWHWRWTLFWCLVRRVTKLKLNYMPKHWIIMWKIGNRQHHHRHRRQQ